LFFFLQGMFTEVLSLVSGPLADCTGLQNLMLWIVTVPYAVNALY